MILSSFFAQRNRSHLKNFLIKEDGNRKNKSFAQFWNEQAGSWNFSGTESTRLFSLCAIIEEVKEVISQWAFFATSLDINKKEFKLIEKALQKKLKEG